MKGCTLIEGYARFEARDHLRVGADLLTAPRIFINVGGRPSVPPLPGINEVPFLTNRTGRCRHLGSDPRDPDRRGASRSAPWPGAFAWAVTRAASRCSSTARRANPPSWD